MAREILQADYDIQKFADFEVGEIEAGFAELLFLRVFGVFVTPHGREAGDFIESW